MTRIFAHRGLSRRHPENTMPAFERALETGCGGIELDVQLCRDGEPVVIHDETVDRTTNGSGKVRDLGLGELRALDASGRAGDGHGADGHGANRIPTLREYFDLVRAEDVITNIELKNYIFEYPGLEEKVVAAVREYDLADKVLFSSFNHQSLLRCRRLAPEMEIAFISGGWMIEPGAYCAAHGADYFNTRFCYLNEENKAELDRRGIRAQAWTVDEEADMERLVGMGVYALITNDPELALRVARG